MLISITSAHSRPQQCGTNNSCIFSIKHAERGDKKGSEEWGGAEEGEICCLGLGLAQKVKVLTAARSIRETLTRVLKVLKLK